MIFWKIYFIIFSFLIIGFAVIDIVKKIESRKFMELIRLLGIYVFLSPVLIVNYLYAFGGELPMKIFCKGYISVLIPYIFYRLFTKRAKKLRKELNSERKASPVLFFISIVIFLPALIAVVLYAFSM